MQGCNLWFLDNYGETTGDKQLDSDRTMEETILIIVIVVCCTLALLFVGWIVVRHQRKISNVRIIETDNRDGWSGHDAEEYTGQSNAAQAHSLFLAGEGTEDDRKGTRKDEMGSRDKGEEEKCTQEQPEEMLNITDMDEVKKGFIYSEILKSKF